MVVVADTLRADFLGCYGFRGDISPNLDRLAADSVRFERCFSQAPWTKPAVATLLTALHPDSHGVTDHEGMFCSGGDAGPRTGVLPAAATTLAEAMRDEGFATAAFVANPWLARRYGFGQGFDTYDDRDAGAGASGGPLLDRARSWLADLGDRPFLLYLHLMDVHGPYDAPLADGAAIAGAPGLGADRFLRPDELRRIPRYLLRTTFERGANVLSLHTWRRRYGAGVRELDRHLGTFFRWLETRGLLDTTLVVVTSDHGEELADHGGWDHGYNLYQHQLHVPLLVRRPGAADAGLVVDEVVGLIDLMPTLLAQAGVEAVPGLEGRDLSGLISGGSAPEPRPVVATATKSREGLYAVIADGSKLIAGPGAPPSLYDLERDPGERVDLARDDSDRVAALEAILRAQTEMLARRPPLTRETAPVDDELADRLRALGYGR